MTILDLFRRIQSLNMASYKIGFEDEEELNFYKTLLSTFLDNIDNTTYQNLVPFSLDGCSIENAKKFADSIGIPIVQGQSGQFYFDISEIT